MTAVDASSAPAPDAADAGPAGPTPPRRRAARPPAPPAIDSLDPRAGWLVTVGIAAFAFLLRVVHLGTPDRLQFDETYYAKDAWSMLHFGYSRLYVDDANDLIQRGDTTGLFKPDGGITMVVHPEVGKWLIALGEHTFGLDAFGWRIASAVAGTLMVAVMVRLARRLTGSTLLGAAAGLLTALDGMQLVLSRLALLDIFVALFLTAAVSCLVADRDWRRRRFAALMAERGQARVEGGYGPVRRALVRPWLVAAGVMFGLSLGTKWSALYALAALGLLVWLWDIALRAQWGVRGPLGASFVVDAVPAFVQLVLVAGLVYVATWTGWLLHAGVYETYLSDNAYGPRWGAYLDQPAQGVVGHTLRALRDLWHYHHDVYQFHTAGLADATHVYQSNPLGWLYLNRPVGIDAQLAIQPGEQGCTAATGSDCLRQVLLLGTPAIWWAGCVASVLSLGALALRRDWRHGLVVVGLASTWLPWLQYGDRPIFSFYAIICLPFLVLSLTLWLGVLIGPAPGHVLHSPARRRWGAWLAAAYVVVVVLNAGWFWPIWTDGLLTHDQWTMRIWFDSWI